MSKSKYHEKPKSLAKLIADKKRPLRYGKNEAKEKLRNLALELGFKKLKKKSIRKIKEVLKDFDNETKDLQKDVPELA